MQLASASATPSATATATWPSKVQYHQRHSLVVEQTAPNPWRRNLAKVLKPPRVFSWGTGSPLSQTSTVRPICANMQTIKRTCGGGPAESFDKLWQHRHELRLRNRIRTPSQNQKLWTPCSWPNVWNQGAKLWARCAHNAKRSENLRGNYCVQMSQMNMKNMQKQLWHVYHFVDLKYFNI